MPGSLHPTKTPLPLEWSSKLLTFDILHQAVCVQTPASGVLRDHTQVPASVFSTSVTPCINLHGVDVCHHRVWSAAWSDLSCWLYKAVERAWLWLISQFTWGDRKVFRQLNHCCLDNWNPISSSMWSWGLQSLGSCNGGMVKLTMSGSRNEKWNKSLKLNVIIIQIKCKKKKKKSNTSLLERPDR